MAQTTDNGQGQTRTGIADVRSAIESAGKAKDESGNSDDDDDSGDDDGSGNDGEGDDDGSADDNTADDNADDSDDASGDDDDSGDGDDDDDGDNSDDQKSQSKNYKYQQYVGDGKPETYISNLEKAHQNSTSQAVQLRTELNQATGRVDAIMKAVAGNPELSQKLNDAINGDGSGTAGDGSKGDGGEEIVNPFVADLQAQWRENSTKEIDEFIAANPEIASDPKIKADVEQWMGIFSREHFKNTGRLLSGGQAMAQAYKHLELENKLDKQNLAAGAKKVAAPSRPRGKVKKVNDQKPRFSSDQLAMAKLMGKDEAWLAKNAK